MHSDFFTNEISSLLLKGCITEIAEGQLPKVVNPLSVSQKIRLILDLRHINQFLHKHKFKLEDLSMATAIIPKNSFLFSFDIKSAYHHIEIEQSCRTYIGLSWEVNDQVKFFIFSVLPFSLSSVIFIY